MNRSRGVSVLTIALACTVVGGRIVDIVSSLDAARLARMDLPAR